MKIAVALIAAGFVASFAAVTPANAQKDPACIEKCNRSNVAGGGGMQSRQVRGPGRQGLHSGLPEGRAPAKRNSLVQGRRRAHLLSGKAPQSRRRDRGRPRPSRPRGL